jgi:RNA polymerase sigma-70 factor (ECF subfamily)
VTAFSGVAANAVTTFPPAPAGAANAVSARVRAAVDAHYDALWRFLRRLGVAEADVEDAAQQVLVVFAQREASVARGAERSFLLGTALRVASDARRKNARSREIAVGDPLDQRVDPSPSAEERLEERQRRRWLDEVLDALPDDHRAVFVLVDIEEQTMAEAAQILGVPPGTVASRLRRARELFDRHAAELKARIEGESR